VAYIILICSNKILLNLFSYRYFVKLEYIQYVIDRIKTVIYISTKDSFLFLLNEKTDFYFQDIANTFPRSFSELSLF